MIRPFDIRDVNVIQRLRPVARALAYEFMAVDGINLLRDAVTSYVTGGRDNNVVLVNRSAGEDGRDSAEAFGLMQLLDTPHASDADNHSHDQDRQRRAALILMSPGPDTDELVESWMYLAQEFAAYAASHGIHHIVAEPAEYGGEAEALYGAGFVPLIHQDVLKLATIGDDIAVDKLPGLREATKADEPLIRILHMRSAPKITYQAEITSDLLRATTPSDEGWLLEHESEVVGYVCIREGRRGHGLQLMFRPKAEDMARPMLLHVLQRIRRRRRGPVYCTVRAYQSWLLPILDELGFNHITSTMLMVRHTAARVHSPVWTGVRESALTAKAIKRTITRTRLNALKRQARRNYNAMLRTNANSPTTLGDST